MRILIGAACIAVLTYVGYFFWGEYERSQALALFQKAEMQAKVRLDYEKGCNRITDTHPSYDKYYVKKLSLTEYQSKIKECTAYTTTRKLP